MTFPYLSTMTKLSPPPPPPPRPPTLASVGTSPGFRISQMHDYTSMSRRENKPIRLVFVAPAQVVPRVCGASERLMACEDDRERWGILPCTPVHPYEVRMYVHPESGGSGARSNTS